MTPLKEVKFRVAGLDKKKSIRHAEKLKFLQVNMLSPIINAIISTER
ncbi:MAG: hypothetical protein QXR51_05140 [Desulfurococcaceae archaeon]